MTLQLVCQTSVVHTKNPGLHVIYSLEFIEISIKIKRTQWFMYCDIFPRVVPKMERKKKLNWTIKKHSYCNMVSHSNYYDLRPTYTKQVSHYFSSTIHTHSLTYIYTQDDLCSRACPYKLIGSWDCVLIINWFVIRCFELLSRTSFKL